MNKLIKYVNVEICCNWTMHKQHLVQCSLIKAYYKIIYKRNNTYHFEVSPKSKSIISNYSPAEIKSLVISIFNKRNGFKNLSSRHSSWNLCNQFSLNNLVEKSRTRTDKCNSNQMHQFLNMHLELYKAFVSANLSHSDHLTLFLVQCMLL